MTRGFALAALMGLVALTAPAFAQQTPEEACASVKGGIRAICITAKRKEMEAQQPPGPVQLNVGSLQRVQVENTPYEHELQINGSGLNVLDEIRLDWSGPRSGQAVWRRGSPEWARVSPSKDGRSARLRIPVLLSNDKPGDYRWNLVFIAAGQEVARSFDVSLAAIAPLNVNGIGQRIETKSVPHEHEFQLSGASLNRITEIRWTWRGPRSGQTTWKPNDSNWKRFSPAKDGKSARVRQTLIGDGDPSGLYGWTVTFVSPVGEVTRSFDVEVPRRNRDGWNGDAYGNGGYGNGNGNSYNNSGGNNGGYDIEAPRRLYPGDGSSPGPIVQRSNVRLEWDPVQGADYYELQVRDVTSNRIVVEQEVRGASFNANLDSYRSYRWTIAACNRRGCSGTARPAYFRTP